MDNYLQYIPLRIWVNLLGSLAAVALMIYIVGTRIHERGINEQWCKATYGESAEIYHVKRNRYLCKDGDTLRPIERTNGL